MNEYPSSKKPAVMGAKIEIKGPPRALYLVIGEGQVESAIVREGGQVQMRFTEKKLLAVLTYDGYLAIKEDPTIIRVGPGNLDMERLKKASQLLSKAVAPNLGSA